MFHIPSIGERLVLTAGWSFTLHPEHRNDDFATMVGAAKAVFHPSHTMRAIGYYTIRATGGFTIVEWPLDPNDKHKHERLAAQVSIPAGTYLTVDRIYIKKGAVDFNSITFNLLSSPLASLRPTKLGGMRKGKARFWVKLHDANKIECRWLSKTDDADYEPAFMKDWKDAVPI